MWWSGSDGRRTSYFYSRNGVEVANIYSDGHYACNGTPNTPNVGAMYKNDSSYDGFNSFTDLNNVSAFNYTGNTVVVFCTKDVAQHHTQTANNPDLANNGLMVYRKNEGGQYRYGVVEFVSISNGDANYPKYMTIKWWLGNTGETDFRDAPNQ
jgi:hypothetical protein